MSKKNIFICEELCFLLDTLLVNERDSWRLSATQDCCFISHKRVVCLHVTTLGNTIHRQSHMQQWLQHTQCTLGMYQGTCLVHACAQPAQSNINMCYKLPIHNAHGLSTRHVTKPLASSMPVHNRHIETSTHAAKSRHTTHNLSTRYVLRRLLRQWPCTTEFNRIRYITENLSAFTHATKAMTHGAYTIHATRCIPHPCPCTADFNKIRYYENH